MIRTGNEWKYEHYGRGVIPLCGRYTLFATEKEIENRFQLQLNFSLNKRYNISPTQEVLVILQDENEKKADFFRWGLIPFWAKDKKIGYRMINARAETLDEKPAFKRLLQRKRCLIVANGFYEWRKTENGKQPYFIHLKDAKPFAFAGLWDVWKQGQESIQSCTIITTQPNHLMEPIHNRMPVILDSESEKIWLDPKQQESDYLKSLLQPYPSELMEAYMVSTLVNNPRNDTAQNLERINASMDFF